MVFSEPSGVTALQSPVLKASVTLDCHAPGSTAVENSVRVKVKVPHEPCFSASLPSQLCSFPCSSALHRLPLNNSLPPPASVRMTLPTSHSLDPMLRVPFPATCWAFPYSSTISCIHLAVQRPQRPFAITMLHEMKPREDGVYFGAAGMLTRG